MVNDMFDTFVQLLSKSFEEQYEKRQIITAQHTANDLVANGAIIPSCKIGDAVYFVCEDDDYYFISENKVTDVSSKGFFVSNYDPPQDDLGCFELYEIIGKDAFLCKESAEQKLKEKRDSNGNL